VEKAAGLIVILVAKTKRQVKKLAKLVEEARAKRELSTHRADPHRQLAVKKVSMVKSLKRVRKDNLI
tara:strand:- start:819 stop:1019 length:201 start_codon:yes stop_codon:yes gene_type:complete